MGGQPFLEIGDRGEIHGGQTELVELVEGELADASFGAALQGAKAPSQLAEDELALSFPAFLEAFLEAFLDASFFPTGCQFHNSALLASVEHCSAVLLEKQSLFPPEPQVAVNEARNEAHSGWVQPQRDEQAQTLQLDPRALRRAHAHAGHERAGPGIGLGDKIPPVQPLELNDSKPEAEDLQVGEGHPVAVPLGPECAVRKQSDGIDRQVMTGMESGKVAVHPARELSLRLGLVLQMDEKKGMLPAKPGLGNQVGGVLFASGDIREHFLVEEGDGFAVEIPAHFGQEQIEELGEATGQQFFDQSVMVHARSVDRRRIPASAKCLLTASVRYGLRFRTGL